MISSIFTAEDIAREIAESVGSLSEVTYDQAYRCINRALRIMNAKGSWPFWASEDLLLTTVSGTQYYRMKQRVRMPKYLHMRNPAWKLEMIDLMMLRKLYPNNTETTGQPLYWRISSYNVNAQSFEVGLWPIPDGEYEIYIDIDQNPLLVTNKNDNLCQLGLPEEMIETMIKIATALMYEKTGDADYQNKMAEGLTQLESDYYRLTNHIDANLNSRVYAGDMQVFSGDPMLPPNYNSP